MTAPIAWAGDVGTLAGRTTVGVTHCLTQVCVNRVWHGGGWMTTPIPDLAPTS